MSYLLLSEQDQQFLLDLHTHIYLDLAYIHQKNYPDYIVHSLYNRLRRLEEAEYIKHELLPLPNVRNQGRKNGRPQKIYTLASVGVEMVRELTGGVHWNKRWSERVPPFVYHSLMLAQVERAMAQASQQEKLPVELKEWVNEPRATFQYTSSSADILRPDAIAVLGKKGVTGPNIGVFVEMERTYAKRDILINKVRKFNDFLEHGEETLKEYDQKVGFEYPVAAWRVVFVARDETKQKQLLRFLEGVESPHIPILFTTYEEITADPFAAIYRNLTNPTEKVRL